MDQFKQQEFWTYLDQLVAACPVTIDRPRRSHHPCYPELVYPLDYGFLEGSTTVDGGGVDVWLGVNGSHELVGVVLTVDLHKKDAELKLLLGTNEEECQTIVNFHNGSGMRAFLVRRP
jgi:inorganic pyrophosphatase